jgi:DNA polymerase I-like protein with 3'-5' exonuclease and polymerase domains
MAKKKKEFAFNIPEPKAIDMSPPPGYAPPDNLPELHGIIALDTETKDPGLIEKRGSSWCRPGEGFITGFSVVSAQTEMAPLYLPVAHAAGNGDADKYFAWLKAQAKKPDVTFVYSNAIYDLGWLLRHDIDPINHPIDVQCMAALLDSDRFHYSLDSLLADYVGRKKAVDLLKQSALQYGITKPYANMDKLPAWAVGPYGIQDGIDTLDVYAALAPKLEAEELQRVHTLERECLLVGRDLRWRGVRVDLAAAERVDAELVRRRDAAIARIADLTGVNVTPNDNPAIARALQIENPDLVMEKTSTGKVAVRAAILESLATPVALAAREMRKMEKAHGTFIVGYIQKFTGPDNRIHAEFHPTRRSRDAEEGGGTVGAGPGRWSSSSPNLQNIPRRDKEIGPLVREIFLPEEGELWGKLDFRQQEPRGATHFASLIDLGFQTARKLRMRPGRLRGAQEMVERYHRDPFMSLHKETAKMMGLDESQYDKAKTINLGILYGMQGKKFCNEMGLPTAWITTGWGKRIEVAGYEGQVLLDKQYAAVPYMQDLAKVAKYMAEEVGFVRSFSGRKMRFDRREKNGRRMFTYKALNNIVQGTAADQMKYALCAMRREGINPLVVVHDDANISIPKGVEGWRLMDRAAEIMAHAIELVVPSSADCKIGMNWGDVSR